MKLCQSRTANPLVDVHISYLLTEKSSKVRGPTFLYPASVNRALMLTTGNEMFSNSNAPHLRHICHHLTTVQRSEEFIHSFKIWQ